MLKALPGSEGIQEETPLPLLMVVGALAEHRCLNVQGDKRLWGLVRIRDVSSRGSGKLLLELCENKPWRVVVSLRNILSPHQYFPVFPLVI